MNGYDVIVPRRLVDLAASPLRATVIVADFVLPERWADAFSHRLDIPAWYITRWIGAVYLAVFIGRRAYRQCMAGSAIPLTLASYSRGFPWITETFG
jgi:hypothetical protein